MRAGYVYGLINHIEILPPVQHLIDPTLFEYDWHVQQTIVFGPRTYFYQLLAAAGKLLPLPWGMLGGTLASNVVTILISFLVGRDLFRDDRAAMLGCAVIGGLHSINLGLATFLIWEHFVQASAAEPLALLALWAGLRGRPLAALAWAGASMLLHPVVGALSGGLALGIIILDALICAARGASPERAAVWRKAAAAAGR